MDRTHFLATQAFPHDRHGAATRAEIDAIYDVHGLEIFARASRLRRSVGALAARFGTVAQRKRDLAPATPGR